MASQAWRTSNQELAPLWHTHPRSISGVERDRDLRGYYDYPADQAKLLSRLLRRPRLLVWPAGRGARAVCLNHHARLDLVVEWFGGPPVAEVAAAFLAAGLDLQPRDRAAQGLRDGTCEWTLKLHAGTDGAGAPTPGGATPPRCLAAPGDPHQSAMTATGTAARCRTATVGSDHQELNRTWRGTP